jgi:uncharacterized protein (DUF1800 family)
MSPFPSRGRALGIAVSLLPFVLATGLGAGSRQAIPTDDRTIEHVLSRLTFGPRPGDLARVKAMGVEAFIERQLHPELIDDRAAEARLAAFETLDMSPGAIARQYVQPAVMARREAARRGQPPAGAAPTGSESPAPPPRAPGVAPMQAGPALVVNELMQAKLVRAVYSERQLQEVLVDFWFNHFNVFVGKGQVRQYLGAYERDAIRPHVLGRFRDLLGEVAHSPAMLIYLDNWQSASPEAGRLPLARGRRAGPGPARPQGGNPARPAIAARAARGLNENYARELMELHTLGVDGGYTEADVVELARILTGWTIDRPFDGGGFVFRPAMHDSGGKRLLGTSFAPAGESEGERALDLLARHPSTARHIAFKLAQRFVADEPPAALVERAARRFRETDGHLGEVVRAIVTSPEFFSTDRVRAKVKTPLEFVVSAVRVTGASLPTTQPLVQALRTLGMPLYGCQPPTGYSMTADAWINTGALLNRMNFAVALVEGRRMDAPAAATGGQRPNQARRAGAGAANRPMRTDLALAPDVSAASQARTVDLVLGGQASDATRATLARAETPQQLVALALGSPEFQRR